MSREEADLIRRAKRGEAAALAEIYDRCQPAIYRYIYYRVPDTATAEDLTSEVFVRLVERIDGFRYRGRPLLAWLYTIARNLVIDHHRQAGRLPLDGLDGQGATETAEEGWDADRTLTRSMLGSAIERLTEDQRLVIILKFVEGLDNQAVARILGKPVGAVKSLQHRALAALRRHLERGGG